MKKHKQAEADAEQAPLEDAPVDGVGLDPEASELDTAARERDEMQARWQRAQADYQNLKRRTASEVEGAVRRSLEDLLQGMLLVLDHLELALNTPTTSEDAEALAQGVRLTRDQFLSSLRAQGVEPVPIEGEFDPNVHEAVATVETEELAAGSVVDCLRRGYTWNGQVLRAAQVRVARAPQATGAEDASE